VPDPVVAAHRAVAGLFVLNAVAFANVVPRLPAIKAELALSNAALGSAVAAMALGALVSGPAAGVLVARFGSARLATACGIGFGLVVPFFGLASSWWALAATFLVLGTLDSWMDVSMNAHALRVQRAMGRSIINTLHGTWSIGAVVGGVAGTLAAAAGVSVAVQAGVAGAVIVAATLLLRPFLLDGPDDADREAPSEDVDAAADRRAARGRLALLGLVVVLSAAIEDAPQSWGAVFLRDELDTGPGVAGLVFVAFQVSMTASRFLGDRLVERFGATALVRVGGLATAAGVGLGLAIGSVPAVVAGFAVAGAGTAALFPVAFHEAGHLPGVSTGQGVAVVAWMGRVGFLVAAPLVGVLGDAASLRAGLVVVPLAGLAVAALARPAFPSPASVVDPAP
jgi:Major Facilitator Superfamily